MRLREYWSCIENSWKIIEVAKNYTSIINQIFFWLSAFFTIFMIFSNFYTDVKNFEVVVLNKLGKKSINK